LVRAGGKQLLGHDLADDRVSVVPMLDAKDSKMLVKMMISPWIS
jgi:hypothetical protein